MMFEAFTTSHYAGMGMAVVLVAAIIAFRSLLRRPRADRIARYVLAALLVGSEISLYISYEVQDNWGVHSLPFQLCSLMIWISAALLVTRHRILYEIALFLGILGAMQAILTPNLDEAYPQFRYFHFFIAHAAIIASSVYMTAVAGFRPTLGAMFRAIGWLHVLAVPAAIANSITGANFMFLARKPETGSLLDLLSPWPWYLLELEVIVLLLCLTLFGVIKAIDWLSRARGTGERRSIDADTDG